jgi:hypothetical protein
VTRKERQRHRASNRERAARIARIRRAIGDAHIELALEDTHLVAEHHDLDVLVL